MTWKVKFEFRILGLFRVPPQEHGDMRELGWCVTVCAKLADLA